MSIAQLEASLGNLSVPDQEFARSLIHAHRRWGSLTPKQAPWVDRLLARAKGEVPTKVGDLAPILALFERASDRLTRPAIVLSTPETGAVRVSVAGHKSKYPGTLQVTGLGGYDVRPWLGRVNKDGTFTPGVGALGKEQALSGLLSRFAAAPAVVASEHGKVTGCCCFCNRALEDKRSVAVGYGPICADNYGLPWK